MKKSLLLKSLLLLCALVVGMSNLWAAEGDILAQLANTAGSGYATRQTKTADDTYHVAWVLSGSSSGCWGSNSSQKANVKPTAADLPVVKGVTSNATTDTQYHYFYYATTAVSNVGSVEFTFATTYDTSTSCNVYLVMGDDVSAANGDAYTQVELSNSSTTVQGASISAAGTYTFTFAATQTSAKYYGLVIKVGNSSYKRFASASLTFKEGATSSPTKVATPSIIGNTPFYSSSEVSILCSTADASIQYSTDDGANWTNYTAAFNITATTTVKAKATKSGLTNSDVASKTFTKVTPMNVASALTAISALANNGTIENQCVRGIVTQVNSYSSNTISYVISDDVSGSNTLTVYKGKGLHNANFAAATDVKLGDDVVIYGTLKKYVKNTTTTPEFDEGNYLLYQVSKDAPTFTLSTSAETLSMGTTETVDVTLTTNTDGAITCESSDDDVATVALKSAGVYTITGHMAGTATITIKSALTANYQPASATVAITVNDTREAAGISFTEDEVEITWGDAFTGQALTNTHSLPVTWSSTNEAVATVNSSGVVSVLKAGSTDIKATFAGNATYKSTVVGYTLTVNKAEAGLSYDQTSFDIMVGDDSFVAPTLNNPNSLTVNYSSSDENVVLVDENTGEITYDENTPGSAIITAYFAGNDNYKGGNAKYTINIIDPTVKGSKYNPYTVAEVIDGTATGSNIYVRGFIVGEYTGKATNPKTSDFGGNSNFAVADAFSASPVVGNCIPVELPSSPSSIRTNWGLKDNPSKVGYQVLFKGNAQSYFSTNGIKGTSEITAVAVPVTVGASKYAAYCSTYALDFSATEVKAYKAKVDGGKVVLTKVDEVPANTGVILYGDADNYTVPVIASAAAVTENELIGVTTRTLVEWETGGDGKYNYILQNGQFKKAATGGHLKANRAYLHTSYDVTSAGARDYLEFSFEGEEETTGVNEVTTTNRTNNTNEFFNLAGQRVAQPTKGLYIVNGKKVMVK
ncbi:MAG: chitobiase/beta-hexosaminidase C-terminal domain-containing protein [Prevotella sp.]|nr:chitobiase/beta-hexosaminidase C-terminal domain-containing protein [Prevotella sp.]